jgi:hypothetical protein
LYVFDLFLPPCLPICLFPVMSRVQGRLVSVHVRKRSFANQSFTGISSVLLFTCKTEITYLRRCRCNSCWRR